MQKFTGVLAALSGLAFVLAILFHARVANAAELEATTAAGKPAEGKLESFLGDPLFEKQVLYGPGRLVRGPNITVAVDGTVLARGEVREAKKTYLRRSEDGGQTWQDPQDVSFRTLLVDENMGDILSVTLHDIREGATVWRSRDHGKTWKVEHAVLKPNDVMSWLEESGLRERGTQDDARTDAPKYYLHTGAAESGITLRHGRKKGRLLNTATFRPHAKAHPSDRAPVDAIFSCAIYSDDGGRTWQVSGLFPEGYTEEAALAELHDGHIYYNSRSHSGYYDKPLARELRADEVLRREAWSYDQGQTWEDLNVSRVLPDGGGYGRGYGMMGGLVRLPVKNRDILIYSNADTGGGDRKKMTVWASFDGGKTWPIKRLVYGPHGAYSSLDAGRPETPSEGQIYLLFEGGDKGHYAAIQVARFNLSWLLKGELTRDGELPAWMLQ